MAQLRDSLVQGSLRVTDKIFGNAMDLSGTLTLLKVQDAEGTADNQPALIIGGPVSSQHIEIDDNEIMAKKTATTTNDIYINASGSPVHLGSTGSTSTDYTEVRSQKDATTTADGALRVAGGLSVTKKTVGASAQFGNIKLITGTSDGKERTISVTEKNLIIDTPTGYGVVFQTATTNKMKTVDDTFVPITTNTGSIGTSSLKWANVYATTFNGALTGTASNATTTADTNALYPVGVTSGATTTLKRDTSITMTGAQLALGNLTIGGTKDTDAGKTIASNSTIYLKTTASASVVFQINSASKCRVDTDGHLRPESNSGVNLGITSVRWKTGYFVTSVEVGTASKAINATDAAGAQIAPTVITQNSIATGGGFYLTQKGTGAARLAVTTLGTTSAGGVTTLTLGNSSNSTTNYNSQGKIVLYSANTAAHTIDTTSTTTAYTHTLPNATGTIAHTADITTAIQALDVSEATNTASKTVNKISETDGKISVTFQDISIGASAIGSGTLAIARGGTNAGSFTSAKMLYYNGTSIASTGSIQFIPEQNAELGSTKGKVNGIIITGATYGNTAANLASNTINVFRYGDPGPQIRFSTSVGTNSAGGNESGALIWSDNSTNNNLDSAFYFVGRKNADVAEANDGVVARNFIAKASLTIGQNYRNTYGKLLVTGDSGFIGKIAFGTTSGTTMTENASMAYNSTLKAITFTVA